jgi:hypothetical protein
MQHTAIKHFAKLMMSVTNKTFVLGVAMLIVMAMGTFVIKKVSPQELTCKKSFLNLSVSVIVSNLLTCRFTSRVIASEATDNPI